MRNSMRLIRLVLLAILCVSVSYAMQAGGASHQTGKAAAEKPASQSSSKPAPAAEKAPAIDFEPAPQIPIEETGGLMPPAPILIAPPPAPPPQISGTLQQHGLESASEVIKILFGLVFVF